MPGGPSGPLAAFNRREPRTRPIMMEARPTRAGAHRVAKPPRIIFHRLIPQARLPQRADRSAAGTLPTRAFRYCEPVVTASAFGYYVFPPFNFSLMWDGTRDHLDLCRRRRLDAAEDCAVPVVRGAFRRTRSGRNQGLLAAVPRCLPGARHPADVERPGRPHGAGLEPAGAPLRQPAAARRLRTVSKASSRPTAGSAR